VNGPTDLLIDQDIFAEMRDFFVGANGKLAKDSRTCVCVDNSLQKILVGGRSSAD
jgi:hypothetical protein